MDETLRQARNRESIGRFVGNVAHDFNNLLMVLQSSLALLGHPLDAESRTRVLDAMRRAVEEGTALTLRMRTFAEHHTPQGVSLDLAEWLPGARERLAGSLRRNIELVLRCEPGLDRVKVDPAELELALLNLCLNAEDAMPAGGTVQVTAHKAGNGVVISVADRGAGMSEEVRSRVFEPFFSTKRSNALTGLGLSQVYAFALQSDGEVRVASETGRGTTVEITLPSS
jgi:signal transduction histidine kinase